MIREQTLMINISELWCGTISVEEQFMQRMIRERTLIFEEIISELWCGTISAEVWIL